MKKIPSRFSRLDGALADLPLDEPMLLTELDGFLTGVLLSPEPVAPDEWLQNVWGVDDGTPPFGGLDIGQPDKAAADYAVWLKAHPAPAVTLSEVADHIDHIAKIAGVDHVGLGSDFDGVGETLPAGLQDVASYPALLAELMRRGWSDADIAKLAGANVLRVMRGAERVQASLAAAGR